MASATCLLTGEAASFKSITPARPFDFTRGLGAIELAARFHALSIDPMVFVKGLSDPNRSIRRAATWGGGLNWYWNKNARFTADCELTEFRRGASGKTNRRTERVVQTRFQVGF
jgi:phosphate-selective porin OprO/OprP